MGLGKFVVVNSLGHIVAFNLADMNAATEYVRSADPGKYGVCQLVLTFDKPIYSEELQVMYGKKVFGVSGPGSSPAEGLANSEGIIISEEHNRFGGCWVVLWTDGEKGGDIDLIPKHSLKTPDLDVGVGVYLAKESSTQ
ncbi:hypothetical protein [Paenibacillus polymyxa]|uniref:hypothetical protein n=1 Tax=Paenibacillus polymyxa TaxID=1406 RepID=UPI0032AFA42E